MAWANSACLQNESVTRSFLFDFSSSYFPKTGSHIYHICMGQLGLDFGDFGDFGFWILEFWILGILGILDFGFWGFGEVQGMYH